MSSLVPDVGRWSSYFLRSGQEVPRFWTNYFAQNERSVLFIIGAGFDPRMFHGYDFDTTMLRIGRGLFGERPSTT